MLDYVPPDDAVAGYVDDRSRFHILGSAVDVPKQRKLETVKQRIGELVSMGNRIMFEITRQFRIIEEERLYEGALNGEGQPYQSMTEYAPDLIREMAPHMSERQFREYLALDRVIVQNGLASPQEIVELGVSHFTKLREALDYNQRTGAIAETPRAGKIGIDTVREVIGELRANPDLSIHHTEALLADVRGVELRKLHLVFAPETQAGISLRRIDVYDGSGKVFDSDGMGEEQAEWLARRIGASSNLDNLRSNGGESE